MRSGGALLRTAIGLVTVLGLAGLAGPVAADGERYACTVFVGTQVGSLSGEPVVVSASSSPAGGVGGCELHTLERPATLSAIDAAGGCGVHADVDEDAFVDERAQEGQVYGAGTSLVAFCDAGAALAENEIALVP